MKHFIDKTDFYELEAMKYHAYPASWDPEKQKKDVLNKIMSGDWYGSQKRDGFFMKFLKDEDGNITFTGRSKSVSGDYINKWEWVPQLHEWGNSIPNGTCFLGEIYWVDNEGSKNTTSIMNCLKEKAIARQEKEENKLHFYVFDILAYDNVSFLKKPALERFKFIEDLGVKNVFKYTEFAVYFNGQELWNTLQSLLADGYEGMVIIQKDSLYEPGKRPSKTTKKIKQALRQSIDVIILGANAPTRMYGGKEILTWKYWENRVTGEKIQGEFYKAFCDGEPIDPITKAYFHGWAGSLIIGLYDAAADKVVPIGSVSGLTEEVLQNWQNYKGKVLEVGGMQLMRDDNGNFTGIRHPKALGWRADKLARECTMDQVK